MAARKTPAKRAPARKAAARKGSAKKTPARKGKTPARKTPAKKARRPRKGPTGKALEHELHGALAPVADTALAASALALARQLDKPRISATATASCSRALLDTLDRLRALLPEGEETDALDDLNARRAARRAGGAGT